MLPWGHNVNAVPGRDSSVLNFLNAKYAPVGHDPEQVLLVPVQKLFLQETGGAPGTDGAPPYEVRVVSSCTLDITFPGGLILPVDFLTFREEGVPGVDMIFNFAPYAAALDAQTAVAEVANSEAGPGSTEAAAATPPVPSGKPKPKGAGKGRTGSRKGGGSARPPSPGITEPLTRPPIEFTLRAPAAVAVGRVQDNALHSIQAVRVCLHSGTNANDLTTKFWMEEVRIPRSREWISESRTVRVTFSSPSAAWHTAHMLTSNQGCHPSLELESEMGAAPRGPFREIWSVFFISIMQHATSLSFAAIMCPSEHVTRGARETSEQHRLSTLAKPDEFLRLPPGCVIQNVGCDYFEGSVIPMVVVLMPPFATRDVNLVSPTNATSPLDPRWRHRKESRVALEDFAQIPWQTEYSSHRTVTYDLPPGHGDCLDSLAREGRNRVESRPDPYPPRDRDHTLPRESRSVARAQASGREIHLEPYPPPESRGCVLPRESRGVVRGGIARAQASGRVMQDVPTAVVGHIPRSDRATPVIAVREGQTALWEMSNPQPPTTSVRTSSPGGGFVNHSPEVPRMTHAARFRQNLRDNSPEVPRVRFQRNLRDSARGNDHASPVRLRPFREPRRPFTDQLPPVTGNIPGREAAWEAIMERFSGVFTEPVEPPLSPGRALSPVPRDDGVELHEASAPSSVPGEGEWPSHLPSAPSLTLGENEDDKTPPPPPPLGHPVGSSEEADCCAEPSPPPRVFDGEASYSAGPPLPLGDSGCPPLLPGLPPGLTSPPERDPTLRLGCSSRCRLSPVTRLLRMLCPPGCGHITGRFMAE